MLDNENRLHELSNKAADGTMSEDELAELARLSMAKKKAREERSSLLSEIRENLTQHAITILDLFSPKEIAAASPKQDLAAKRLAPTARERPAKTARTVGTWVRQKKAGVVLVEVSHDGVNGFPSRYCMGQAMPPYVSKGLKLLDDGQLEANLERYYTAKGRAYFATDAGRAELAQLVTYIRTHKLKPPLKVRLK